MSVVRTALFAWALAGIASGGLHAASRAASYWQNSLVPLEINRTSYDYLQPWNQRTESIQKMGVVIGPREILTTADRLADLSLVRMQRGGRGKWWDGELTWIDYQVNLAILTVPDEAFWKDLKPVRMADPIPTSGEVQILRWRNGILESRTANINRFVVKRGPLTRVEHLHLELDTEMNGLGWGEPVVAGNRLIGLACLMQGNTCTVLPTPFFKPILAARKAGTFTGLGYFDFVWSPAKNPSTLSYLKLPGEPRGALVLQASTKPGRTPVMKENDIILKVDGFEIDNEGDYKDPDYGNLALENLGTRLRWAGEEVKLTVWRDGSLQEVTYVLPLAEYTDSLIPDRIFDRPPEYLVAGGLLFQPLNGPFLSAWGSEWRQRLPFRLTYYEHEKPSADRPSLVLLSAVLPDDYNLGYADYRLLVLDKINGRRIVQVADVRDALLHPDGGYHILEFAPGESLRRMVLDAAQMPPATLRVLERYGIDQAAVIRD